MTPTPSIDAQALRRAVPYQAGIGLGLAALIIAAWLAVHVYGVFSFTLPAATLELSLLAGGLVILQCWLNVGLFIVAHDAMHGSLAPGRRGLNRAMGQLCLGLYASFSYDKLKAKHHLHHRHSGTADDPDYLDEHPQTALRWYYSFIEEYFGWRELIAMSVIASVYVIGIGVPLANLLAFWALPAILSSLQLFYFGTYLPHRLEELGFTDQHNARTNNFGYAASLFTCFHFGYHHEHHLHPTVPWWRLPQAHAAYLAREPGKALAVQQAGVRP